MRKILLISLISFVAIMGLNAAPAQAEIIVIQVTSNSSEDSMPQIKGSHVVWQRYWNGDWEIFLYDMTTGLIQQITNNNHDDISPQTDGKYVVWMACSGAGGEICIHNIATGESRQITNNTNIDSLPRIADGRVVWTSNAVADSIGPGEIVLHDIETKVTEQLTSNAVDDSSPRISSDAVIWVRMDQDDNGTMFVHYLPCGPTVQAPEGFVWEESPQTDGDLTVSMINDGNDWEITLANNAQKEMEQITDNFTNDRYPRISGDNIVWMNGQGGDSEIYLASHGTVVPPDLEDDGNNLARLIRDRILQIFSGVTRGVDEMGS